MTSMVARKERNWGRLTKPSNTYTNFGTFQNSWEQTLGRSISMGGEEVVIVPKKETSTLNDV